MRRPDDLFGEAAYRFWFLHRSEKAVLCLEPVRGQGWRQDGDSFDLPALYLAQARRVAGITALPAGSLL